MLSISIFIIQLAVIIIVPIYIYRNAKENGHNAGLWTLITVGIGVFGFFTLQFLIGMVIGILAFIDRSILDLVMNNSFYYFILVNLISVVFCIICYKFVANKVSEIKDEPNYQNPPSPSEYFGNNNS
jgi:hypothetical protein